MVTERVVVRELSWRDVCPWLILFRTFTLAAAAPVLFLATMGVALTPLGWRLSELCFVRPTMLEEDRAFERVVQTNSTWPHQRFADPAPARPGDASSSGPSGGGLCRRICAPARERFVLPLTDLASTRPNWDQGKYYSLGLAWMLIVWAVIGGAISRIAVVKLGREERISVGEALQHARRRLLSYVGSPLFPLVGIFFVGLPIFVAGLLMQFDIGLLAVSVLWFVVLPAGLLIVVLAIGFFFGWPLTWGVVNSAEPHGDAFEAFSRSFSYTFQRPLHYAFYVVLGVLYAALSYLFVHYVSEAVIAVTRLIASLGAGADRWAVVAGMIQGTPGSGLASWAATLIGAFESLVRTVAAGFSYSMFWCLAAAVYLLLRRDVDETEFDEVFVENEDQRYELPQLDSMGHPVDEVEEEGRSSGKAQRD